MKIPEIKQGNGHTSCDKTWSFIFIMTKLLVGCHKSVKQKNKNINFGLILV